jgi:hypothetical protein
LSLLAPTGTPPPSSSLYQVLPLSSCTTAPSSLCAPSPSTRGSLDIRWHNVLPVVKRMAGKHRTHWVTGNPPSSLALWCLCSGQQPEHTGTHWAVSLWLILFCPESSAVLWQLQLRGLTPSVILGFLSNFLGFPYHPLKRAFKFKTVQSLLKRECSTQSHQSFTCHCICGFFSSLSYFD